MKTDALMKNLKAVSWHDLFNVRSLGFALIRAWGFLTIFGTLSSALKLRSYGGALGLSSTFATVVILIMAGLFPQASSKILGKKPAWIAILCLCPAGTALLALAAIFDIALLAGIGMIANSVGAALVLLHYGSAYGKRGTLQNAVEVPFSLLVAALIFAVVAPLPDHYIVVAYALLPLASGAIALTLAPPRDNASSQTKKTNINAFFFTRKLGVTVMLAGFADGLVRAAFLHNPQGSEYWFLSPVLWSCAMSLCIIWPCVLLAQRNDLRIAYRSTMFAIAAFFMLLPTLTALPFLQDVISLSGFEVFSAFVWVYLARIVNEWSYSPTAVFGLGWGLVYAGNLLGIAGGMLVNALEPLSPEMSSLAVFISSACVLLSYFFVFDESDMTALSQKPHAKKADRRPFQEVCAEIARGYNLSPRETEVMMLAAKGRTLPKIQEELYISQGTAATHMRNIYRKLDVHSRQELLEIVESGTHSKQGNQSNDTPESTETS